jgi:phage shock protein C
MKRLSLSRREQKVGGVCGGLGAYFGLDPIFFRVGFILAVLIYGTGLLAYLVLWLLMPTDR